MIPPAPLATESRRCGLLRAIVTTIVSGIVWSAVLPSAFGHGEAASAERATEQGRYEAAWQEAASFLFNDAHKRFRTGDGGPAAERERLLGSAVTLLNVQPRSTANLAQARQKLEQLVAKEGASDEVSILARFFLARFHSIYEGAGADPSKAKRLYRELLKKHAGHRVAEYSAVSLVLLELYEPLSGEERAARFASLEALAEGLQTSSGRRDFHLMLGRAYIQFQPEGANAKALAHFLKGDAEGITRWQAESEAWISIGELAHAEGRLDLARAYYGKFLAKYQRDNRHYTIRKRLEALERR